MTNAGDIAVERGPGWCRRTSAALLLALAMLSSACTALRHGTTDTSQPLGYPTTVLGTTTLPPSAQLAEGGVDIEQLPPSLEALRGIDWSGAGRRSDRPSPTASVADFGARADDDESDSAAFAAAVAFAGDEARAGRPTTVTVPSGHFLLTDTLALQSGVVLQGSGPDATFLELDLGGSDIEGITLIGAPSGDWDNLTETAEMGDDQLFVNRSYPAGQVVEVEQDNDDRMRSLPEWDVDWGEGSSGEVALVIDDGNESAATDPVVLDHRVLDTYDVGRNARIRPLNAIVRSGVESMTIERIDTGYGHTIAIRFAFDVWVADVELIKTSRSHIGLDVVGRCQVTNSRIHGAHDYGDGGRAYGISVARHTTGCLFEGNALWDLRHALIIQLGASGNVFGYNDARGSAGYEERDPRADVSIHGHWPQANLFEGNVVERFVFADWWGPSGPTNTLWRGCVLQSVDVRDGSHDQAIVASVIGGGGIAIDDEITGTLAAANVIDGTAAEDSIDIGSQLLPTSMYGADEQPPTINNCTVVATAMNPWAQPGADRP